MGKSLLRGEARNKKEGSSTGTVHQSGFWPSDASQGLYAKVPKRTDITRVRGMPMGKFYLVMDIYLRV